MKELIWKRMLVSSANVGRYRVNTVHRDIDDDNNRKNLGTDLCTSW